MKRTSTANYSAGMTGPFLPYDRIRELAGDPKMFARGEKYFAEGQVTKLELSGNRLAARVEGTDTYRVSISLDGQKVSHSCTCPVGDDGLFCKHCVAAALAAMSEPDSGRATPSAEQWLQSRSRGELLEIVLAARHQNPEFADYIDLLTETSSESGTAILFDKLEKAFLSGGKFVNWARATGYSRKIHQIVDSLAEVLRRVPQDEITVERLESAIKAAEKRLDGIDDSDGQYHPVIDRLEELHLEACRKARPDPVKLAGRLFRMELQSGWETFDGALETYREVLGTRRLKEYRKLAEAEWKTLKPIGPGGKDPEQYGRRARLEQVMLKLAEQEKDWRRKVRILSLDLSMPNRYRKIFELCLENGDRDSALEWARRGWEDLPEYRDHEFAVFLCQEYFRRKQAGDALPIAWQMFERHPGLESYRFLKVQADQAKRWTEWRERTWDHLQGKTMQQEAQRSRGGRSAEVEILLWEGKPEEAWTIANAGGCYDYLWQQLAENREKPHPDDAVRIYQTQLEKTLRITGNDSYKEAVRLLRRIQHTLKPAKRTDDFIQVLASVKTAHKAKRNLMKMIDAEKWD
ncbi:MAG: SWIM zinc finger family protein [Deltaproteobacteria bacterium]|nr:SWIM zinc finger family protein [Deltaproteobacteria bacterium]